MFYREDKNFISEDQGQELDDLIMAPHFPWFFSNNQVVGDGLPFIFHIVLNRPEDRILLNLNESSGHGPLPVDAAEDRFNSTTGPFLMSLFNQFAEQNDIKYKEIYRCCINLSFPLKGSSTPHTDHDFPYNHFLIYINDSDGDTCIFDEKGTKIEKRITPEKHKGVCFEKRLHYAEFPTNGLRFVVAYTFI